MIERKTEDQIAALEQARSQIEIALSSNEDWQAFRRAPAGPNRLLHERALAGNPLFRSWELLNEAIRDLHAKTTRQPAPIAAADDLTRIRGIAPALARRLADRGVTSYGQIAEWGPDDVRDVAAALGLGRKISRDNWIEQAALLEHRRGADKSAPPADGARPPAAPAKAPSVELRHILEHIRRQAASRGDLPSVSGDRRGQAPNAAPPASVELVEQRPPEPAAPSSHADAIEPRQQEGAVARQSVDSAPGSDGAGGPLPEEATVTFVIREREEAGRDVRPGPLLSDRVPAVEDGDASSGPSAVQPEEAEVVIVSRPLARSPRSARGIIKAVPHD